MAAGKSGSSGKRIFVTGGASGFGRAIAERWARAGYRVCIGDINDERLVETRRVAPCARRHRALAPL